MVRRDLAYICVGFLVAFFGCAFNPTFLYKYYGMNAVSYDGSLLGPLPADDLTLKTCEGIGKCVVMLQTEFFKLKLDYMNLEIDLNTCQSH